MYKDWNTSTIQSSIIPLNSYELDYVNGAGENDGEAVAAVAGGIATFSTISGPATPFVLAVAATTLLIAFAVEAFESK